MVGPEMVMLDEPMAGVNPALTQSLLGHVKDLREDGMTVLFVEHDMDMVRDISDWVIVMAQGKIIAEGPPDAVMGDPRVIDAYLGSHHDAALTEEDEQQVLPRPRRRSTGARRGRGAEVSTDARGSGRRAAGDEPGTAGPSRTRRQGRRGERRGQRTRSRARTAAPTRPVPRTRCCAPTSWSPATCRG